MMTMMELFLCLIVVFAFLPLQTSCQTVQDDWTAPAAPDGSTPLQSGSKFTLLWKRNLQNSFEIYCPSCNTTKLDLWITNFNGTKYQSKIGRGLDLTTALSYDWNVQIASSEFSEKDWWVFRFTFFDSIDPWSEQISSPGFRISGLVKAVSTSTVQERTSISTSTSASATSSQSTSTSTTTTPANVASSSASLPEATETTSVANSSPRSNVWISGVVIGPIVGIALGAGLMWFCLRKRKNRRAHRNQDIVHDQIGRSEQHMHGQNPLEKYSQTVRVDSQPWQQQVEIHSNDVAEAPGDRTPAQPAELWQGNYRS